MVTKTFLLTLVASSLIGVTACAMGKTKPNLPLDTVSSVDLERYTGTWYEIARLPQSFEKGCVGVTATYQKRSDGKIDVLNTCHQETLDGPSRAAHGTGKVVDSETNAKLKVTFFWPFYGDYWILELGPNYEYSVVGSPDRGSFWILSRTPTLPADQIQGIVSRFTEKSFDLSTLYRTPQ